jgi:exodeoxyribonuclease V gamma subunit
VLHLHRAERADRLADALAEVLRVPPADPFVAEVVAVPAKGVERWLSQRLSAVLGVPSGGGGGGVSANLAFPSPARLVAEALAAAGGVQPQDDPWAPGRVLWRLLEVVDDCSGQAWCGVLARHLGAGNDSSHRRGRRWSTAASLAELFAAYGAERPQMLLDWAAGRDTDGAGAALPADQRWQAELWRRLREELAAPSPAERLAGTCARLRAEPSLVGLPERLSLFGPTRLTSEQLAVVTALAGAREVHLWVPHPSPALWGRLSGCARPVRRRDDRSSLRVGSPLLASLARDTRELQQRLQPLVDVDTRHDDPEPSPPRTLLQHLQAALRDDEPPARVAAADGTVQVHACHGPGRQVQVLREALLHAFEADRSLEPRDVLVLCPDVETWAPLVRAAFGQGAAAGPDAHPGHGLRVRLADRSLRQTNPLLDTVSGLLHLAGGRVTASEVLDLAATAPVRRRFGLHDDDVEQLRTWAVRAGVRWGIGTQQRAAHDLAGLRQGTWSTGLDRVLVGVTADESELAWLDTALPLDDVDSTDVELTGRLAELVDRLWSVLARLQGPSTPAQWVEQLVRALDLLTDVPEREGWQRAQARRELAAAVEHAGAVELRLADVRVMLASRLAGRPTRAGFRTGDLTVCTMVPMRSVPHRVVALLGLDDDAFPRGAGVDGDDVLARDPCIGERDRRSEDRQLLLDAVLSAGDRLVVLYTGADPVTGQERPPAVPLGELLDVLTRTVPPDAAGQLVHRHPLQAFDPRNVDAARPFSFDRLALRAAQAAVGERRPRPQLLTAPLPELPPADVDLAELVAFVQHPVQAFLRQRLGVRVPDEHDEVVDALSTGLEGLQRWEVGERMLAARLRGVEEAAFRQAELRRGTLPPGRLGLDVLVELQHEVGVLVQACQPLHTGLPRSVDLALGLGGGRLLTGTVAGLHDEGGATVLAGSSYSRLAAKHRLAAWVRLLAVAATEPRRQHRAVTTGRGPHRKPVWRSTLTAPDEPLEVLRQLVDLRDRGLQAPLPVAPGASAVYADRRLGGATVQEALSSAGSAFDDRFGDGADRHLRYVHGSAGLPALLAGPPADDERWSREPSRFGALALRLWTPLLLAEHVGSP